MEIKDRNLEATPLGNREGEKGGIGGVPGRFGAISANVGADAGEFFGLKVVDENLGFAELVGGYGDAATVRGPGWGGLGAAVAG